MKLSAVEVSVDTLLQHTDLSGTAVFPLLAGDYQAAFSRSGYRPFLLEHQVWSDTSFEVQLEKTHGQIKFRLTNEGSPVNGALVVLGSDSLLTNALGICIFESLALDSSYAYTISKELYYALAGDLMLIQDTTLGLQFSRSVANVTFTLDAESTDAVQAFAILDPDTAWFNREGIAKFYNCPLEQEINYRVLSDNYPEFTASLVLRKDTTVRISLHPTACPEIGVEVEYQVYPNPATDQVYISCPETIDQIELWSSSGIPLKVVQVQDHTCRMDVSGLSAGYYWLVFGRSDGLKVLRPLVVN
jgi:hypothetical protein